MVLHTIRRFVTRHSTDLGLALAPRFSAGAIAHLERRLAQVGPHVPGVARTVAENMQALGVYTPENHRAYFENVAQHFAGALHVFRCEQRSRGKVSEELRRLIVDRIEFDDSVALLEEAAARGRGVVVMGPHIANFLFNLARLNHVVPMTIYMRYSRHEARREAKMRWCRASGMQRLVEPASTTRKTGRLASLVRAVAGGATVFITPDMPRKRGDGTPVRFFDREIYLPAGAPVLAARACAPLLMLTAESRAGRQRLHFEGPANLPEDCDDSPRAAVQAYLDYFAVRFERFVRTQPALWFSWGDKRWTRLLRGNTNYARPLPTTANNTEQTGVI